MIGDTYIGETVIGDGFALTVAVADPIMAFEYNFVGDEEHWRTHGEVYFCMQYTADDERTPIFNITAFGLAGTLRSVALSPSITLDLTPYLSWQPNSHLQLLIPTGALASVPPGRYEIELVGVDGARRKPLLFGIVELRKSVHRA